MGTLIKTRAWLSHIFYKTTAEQLVINRSTMRSIFYLLSLVISAALAIPVEDGGRLSRYRYKTTSFSDIDGNTLEDSYSNEGAELNDEPLYIVTNEGKLRDFYGQRPEMREAYDVYNPLENIHQHSDRINDQEETYIEPLDDNAALIPEDMMTDEVEEMEMLPREFAFAGIEPQDDEDMYYDDENDDLANNGDRDYYEA